MNMKTMTTILLLCASLGATAQTAREEIKENIYLSGSNYLDYNHQLATTPLTAAPKGYEPFYMSHYGRHGSRWLIGESDYTSPLNTLREANSAGKLTAEGKAVLKKLEDFYPTTVKRLGELTTVGERQHHGIGSRLVKNFPEIFKAKNVPIDARSTVVIRCILSMEAECEELAAANPTARIHNDVSESFQYYLNQDWSDRLRKASREGRKVRNVYERKYNHPQRLMKVLFNDQDYVYDNIRASSLMRQLFEVASNMQSHDTDIELYSIFTDEEIYDQWRIRNVGWYLDYGAAPQSGRSVRHRRHKPPYASAMRYASCRWPAFWSLVNVALRSRTSIPSTTCGATIASSRWAATSSLYSTGPSKASRVTSLSKLCLTSER